VPRCALPLWMGLRGAAAPAFRPTGEEEEEEEEEEEVRQRRGRRRVRGADAVCGTHSSSSSTSGHGEGGARTVLRPRTRGLDPGLPRRLARRRGSGTSGVACTAAQEAGGLVHRVENDDADLLRRHLDCVSGGVATLAPDGLCFCKRGGDRQVWW